MYENTNTSASTIGTITIDPANTATTIVSDTYDYKKDLVFGIDGNAYRYASGEWFPDWTCTGWEFKPLSKTLSEELYKRGITASEAADAICIILKLFSGKDCDSGSLEPKPISDERLNKLFGLEE